jgi:hypothetical protein
MAVVEIFSGILGAGEVGPWVEVPESGNYMISGSGSLNFSLDGVSFFTLQSNPKLVSPSVLAAGAVPAYQLLNLPVRYMRVTNASSPIEYAFDISVLA